MDGQAETTTGRAAVRQYLTERLAEAGLSRKRGTAAAVHEAMLVKLADHLAYMTTENLMTLAEVVLDNAPDGQWPSEAVIRGFAHALQPPPVAERRIVSSWLASVEGPSAEAGGYLVELYRFLANHGRPPLSWDLRQMRERAAENARQAELTRGRIERDEASREDRQWLEAYLRDQTAARTIVDQGKQKRQEAAE